MTLAGRIYLPFKVLENPIRVENRAVFPVPHENIWFPGLRKKKLIFIISADRVQSRVRSFAMIWIGISDPRSVWIMVHQRNQRIYGQSGFTSSFDAP